MSIHFDPAFDAMPLCEWKLRLALKRGYLTPQPGSPWPGAKAKTSGGAYTRALSDSLDIVEQHLREHGPMTRGALIQSLQGLAHSRSISRYIVLLAKQGRAKVKYDTTRKGRRAIYEVTP